MSSRSSNLTNGSAATATSPEMIAPPLGSAIHTAFDRLGAASTQSVRYRPSAHRQQVRSPDELETRHAHALISRLGDRVRPQGVERTGHVSATVEFPARIDGLHLTWGAAPPSRHALQNRDRSVANRGGYIRHIYLEEHGPQRIRKQRVRRELVSEAMPPRWMPRGQLHAPDQGFRCSKLTPKPIDLGSVMQAGSSRRLADAVPQDHPIACS